MTKNRYGENNKKFIYSWDIDLGTFRFVSEEGHQKDTELPLQNARNSIPKGMANPTDVF